MGFGAGLPLFVVLGFLVLGPKRMHQVLRRVAKAKAAWERSSREIKSRLAAEIEGSPPSGSRLAATPDSTSPTGVCTMERNGPEFDT